MIVLYDKQEFKEDTVAHLNHQSFMNRPSEFWEWGEPLQMIPCQMVQKLYGERYLSIERMLGNNLIRSCLSL